MGWISKTSSVKRVERQQAARFALSLAEQTKLLAQAEMLAPKSGVVYGSHQASAPGEAPAVETSALIRSGYAVMTGELKAEAGFSDEKAEDLELGTTRIAPRSFLLPALLQVAREWSLTVKRWF